MAEGCIYIYTGDGRGKSPAAIGRAVQAAVEGKRVVIIQFLKGKGLGDSDFLRRMEPEIKLFRFEKSDGNFVELPEEKKQEEIQNIRNGIGFAKKVLTTGECDLLILDDLGTEYITPLTISVLYELINTRMLTERPTIYTTNITDQSVFAARYTEKVASRILGSCRFSPGAVGTASPHVQLAADSPSAL